MDQEEKNNSGIDLSKSFGRSGEKIPSEKQSPEYFFCPETPKIIQWVIKYSGGLIKNENQATYVLIGLVVLAIIISLFLFFGGEKAEIEAPPGQRIIYPPNEPPRLQQPFE